MKHSEVLSRYVNTGKHLSKEQYNRLTPVLKKSYIRIRSVAGFKDWEYEFISDNQRINYIEIKGVKLSHYDIQDLFKYSENKDDIATKIIETFGEKLVFGNIYNLLGYSENKDDIATKIIEVKGEKLDDSEVRSLMTKKYFNIDNIAIKIIETFGERLDSEKLKLMMLFSVNKADIARKIIKTKGIQLNSLDIENLIIYLSSNERYEMSEKIIYTKGKELNGDDIFALFNSIQFTFYPEKKELIKKLLLQNGVDYKLINKVISDISNEINTQFTPLIPYNYQSMLNEIKRIKQIML